MTRRYFQAVMTGQPETNGVPSICLTALTPPRTAVDTENRSMGYLLLSDSTFHWISFQQVG